MASPSPQSLQLAGDKQKASREREKEKQVKAKAAPEDALEDYPDNEVDAPTAPQAGNAPAAPDPNRPKNPKPTQTAIEGPSSLPYYFPKNFAGTDDIIATLLHCRDFRHYQEILKGEDEFITNKRFFMTLWYFAQQAYKHYSVLACQQIAKGRNPAVTIGLNDIEVHVQHYHAKRDHWKLVQENPRELIHPTTVLDLDFSYSANNGAGAWRVASILNTLKAANWVLQRDNLGSYLPDVGELEGKSLKMWVIAFIFARRFQARASTPDINWDMAEFKKRRINLANNQPKANLPPIWPAEGEAVPSHVVMGEEEDINADLAENFRAPPAYDAQVAWTMEDIEEQYKALGDWMAAQTSMDDNEHVDAAQAKNIYPRPVLSVQARKRAIAAGLKHTEILAKGDHERLAIHTTAVQSTVTSAMQTFEDEAVPEANTPARKEWEAKRDEIADDETQKNFLAFQQMIVGGYSDNLYAKNYRAACQSLHMEPSDPYWKIGNKKCSLKSWQVIGIDWMRSLRKKEGINPLLADDCGLGKTIQGLGALYAEYLDGVRRVKRYDATLAAMANYEDAVPPERPVFRPSMVVCPRILATNWVLDNMHLLNNGLKIYVWTGRQTDTGNTLIPKELVIDHTAEQVQNMITTLDRYNPETARTVFITSYSTGWNRALYRNGKRVGGHHHNRVEELDADGAPEQEAERPADMEDDQDGAKKGQKKKREVVVSTPLAGLFAQVLMDESHKSKSTKTCVYDWIEALRPEDGYWFLSATPMPNNIEDLTAYLRLSWNPEWENDSISPQYPYSAIGLFSQCSKPPDYMTNPDGTESDIPIPKSADADCPRTKAILDPALFRACLDKGTMNPEISSRYLPAVLEMMAMRRTMASEVFCVDKNGAPVWQRIGEEVPKFISRVIEVGYTDPYLYEKHHNHQQLLVQKMSHTGGTAPSAQRGGDAPGRRDTACHKRLQVMTLSAHMEPFTNSYMTQNKKVGVAETNVLQEWGNDKGLTAFQLHAQADPNVSAYSSRFDMALWILKCSPKLAWLCDYAQKCQEANERVSIFCQWPTSQWLIEATFTLLGLTYVSVRSEKTVQQRQEAIVKFTNLNTHVTALVASYATAALGLNIQSSCHRVIHVELPHNMSTIMQANGRTHRLGQKHEQEFFILSLDHSYDQIHMARIGGKYMGELAASLVIPVGAELLGNVRPELSEDTRGAVDEFDGCYRRAVISDIFGTPRDVLEFGNLLHIVSFSTLFHGLLDRPEQDGMLPGELSTPKKAIPMRVLKNHVSRRTPDKKDSTKKDSTKKDSTKDSTKKGSRKRKASNHDTPGDAPSSPLEGKSRAEKRRKSDKAQGHVPGQIKKLRTRNSRNEPPRTEARTKSTAKNLLSAERVSDEDSDNADEETVSSDADTVPQTPPAERQGRGQKKGIATAVAKRTVPPASDDEESAGDSPDPENAFTVRSLVAPDTSEDEDFDATQHSRLQTPRHSRFQSLVLPDLPPSLTAGSTAEVSDRPGTPDPGLAEPDAAMQKVEAAAGQDDLLTGVGGGAELKDIGADPGTWAADTLTDVDMEGAAEDDNSTVSAKKSRWNIFSGA